MAKNPNFDPETGEPLEEAGLAMWQKLLAVLSLVLGGVGLAMTLSAEPSGGPTAGPAAGPTVGPASANGVTPDGFAAGMGASNDNPTDRSGETASELPVWAPLAAKGGLSFFLAFCIGFALRAALKMTILVIGVLALAFLGLQQLGVIDSIDWSRAQGHWDDLTANLGTQVEGLKRFVQGSLPSAASGAVGLVAGFQRRG